MSKGYNAPNWEEVTVQKSPIEIKCCNTVLATLNRDINMLATIKCPKCQKVSFLSLGSDDEFLKKYQHIDK